MSTPLPAFDIAGVPVAPALMLAPMSGVTDSPFRRLIKQASGDAVGMVTSEFIKTEMLTRRELKSMVRMAFHASERPVSIQIYGADVDVMCDAARMVEDAGADTVDLNCGCPAPKVVKRGGGAALLKSPASIGRLLEAMSGAVSIPVTVKIRNGWCESSLNAVETLRVAEEAGAKALAIHGRTRVQLYRGVADWSIVGALAERARIPIIGSGDIVTAHDALRRFAETGCHGVMIGRAAITNPWIFRQIADLAAGRDAYQPTWGETVELVGSYHEMLLAHYPAKVAPGRVKMMLSRLLKQFPGDPDLRKRCLTMADPVAMLAHLAEVCRELGLWDTPRETPTTVPARQAA